MRVSCDLPHAEYLLCEHGHRYPSESSLSVAPMNFIVAMHASTLVVFTPSLLHTDTALWQ